MDPDVDSYALADMLWAMALAHSPQVESSKEPASEADISGVPNIPDDVMEEVETGSIPAGEQSAETVSDTVMPAFTQKSFSNEGIPASRFRAPAARALPDSMAIERALRPLRRLRRSSGRLTLDPEATAELSAKVGTFMPSMRKVKVRWFSLTLVIDVVPSVSVWEDALLELSQVMRRSGAFSNVSDMKLVIQPDGPALKTRTGRLGRFAILPATGSEQVFMILTDGTGDHWRLESTWHTISRAAGKAVVSFLHLLPERLWPHTALAVSGTARADQPVGCNLSFRIQRHWWDLGSTERMPYPITTLHPGALATWATCMVGHRASVPLTFGVMEHCGEGDDSVASQGSEVGVSTAERVSRFTALASPIAYKLATYLSAVPLTLPVMRLVQNIMIPGSGQQHLAEILLGGIVGINESEGPDSFSFYPGVREHLQQSLLLGEAEHIIDGVSRYLQSQIGASGNFSALLYDPDGLEKVSVEALPFARLGRDLLTRFRHMRLPAISPNDPDYTSDLVAETTAEQAHQRSYRVGIISGDLAKPLVGSRVGMRLQRRLFTLQRYLDYYARGAPIAIDASESELMGNESALIVICNKSDSRDLVAQLMKEGKLILPVAFDADGYRLHDYILGFSRSVRRLDRFALWILAAECGSSTDVIAATASNVIAIAELYADQQAMATYVGMGRYVAQLALRAGVARDGKNAAWMACLLEILKPDAGDDDWTNAAVAAIELRQLSEPFNGEHNVAHLLSDSKRAMRWLVRHLLELEGIGKMRTRRIRSEIIYDLDKRGVFRQFKEQGLIPIVSGPDIGCTNAELGLLTSLLNHESKTFRDEMTAVSRTVYSFEDVGSEALPRRPARSQPRRISRERVTAGAARPAARSRSTGGTSLAESLLAESPRADSLLEAEFDPRMSTLKRTIAKKTAAKKITRKKSSAKKSSAKKSTAKKTTRKKAAAKRTIAKKSTAKKTARKKAAAKKTIAKKSTAKKTTRKKAAAKKTTRKKSTAKKTTRKKAAAKETTRKKVAAKKTTSKTAAQKVTARKTGGRKSTRKKKA